MNRQTYFGTALDTNDAGRRRSRSSRLGSAAILLVALSCSSIAAAQDGPPPAGEAAEWDIRVGAGAVVRPTFEGSDKERVSPVPFFSVVWNDRVSVGADGISAYWRGGGLRVGGGLTFDPGRKDHETNRFFANGDDRLEGLGNIKAAPAARVFASYAVGSIELGTSLVKRLGKTNDGLTADATIGTRLPIGEALMLRPHVGVTWADENYMQTYFGVTPTQSANSGFAAFGASAGIKSVGVGINATYRLGSRWSLLALAKAEQLTGDARKSPLSFSNQQGSLGLILGYHF